jgi:hypothetical protein
MCVGGEKTPFFITDSRVVNRQKIIYWVVAVIAPFLFSVPIAIHGNWPIALVFFAWTCMIMLLNGHRTIIGLAVFEQGIRITTPLSVADFAWDDVRVTGYGMFHRIFGLTEVYVKEEFLPYKLAGLWHGQGRAARLALLAQYRIFH